MLSIRTTKVSLAGLDQTVAGSGVTAHIGTAGGNSSLPRSYPCAVLAFTGWMAVASIAAAFPYADGPQLPPDTRVRTAWHMADVWVDLDHAPGDFETFCITFRIEGETADDVNFYFAPFNGAINQLTFYGGIQTHINGLRPDGRFVARDKGAIFSRWRERDTDAIMAAPGGLYRSLGSEGDFISVRNDFAWGQGRYRLCLRKSDLVEGDPLPENYDADDIAMSWGRYEHTWVRMEATDLSSNDTTFIGALAVPGKTLALRRRNALFAEIYGRPSPFPAERVPDLKIAVENFQLNGETLSYRTVTSFSNTIPGNGAEPNMTRILYAQDDREINIELGRFSGRFGRIARFVYPSQPAVESVGLVTAEDRNYILAIWDERELQTGQLPSGRFNIRADPVDPGEVASVRLELKGPVSLSRLTNEAPYLLSNDAEGFSLPEGDYRITVTPYSKPDGGGVLGVTLDSEFSVSSAPLPTRIDDDNLLTHIASALDATLTEDNIAKEMERLESLVVSGAGIANLDGLELAGNLSVLKLPDNRIKDLSPLSRLSNLVELDLSRNRIDNVTPLCDLTRLRCLNVSDNRISDFHPLAGIEKLEHLNASGNELSSLASLAGLTTLTHLEVASNEVRKLGPLAALASLEVLDLSANQVESLGPLAGLIALRELHAKANMISELGPLAGLINLERLEISRNRISELGPLAGMSQLMFLAANDNRLFRLDPLSGLLALERLELDSNWLTSVAPLAGLNQLSVLQVRHNRIYDFTPLDPLVEQGLQVIGASEQLRAIMKPPPQEPPAGEY